MIELALTETCSLVAMMMRIQVTVAWTNVGFTFSFCVCCRLRRIKRAAVRFQSEWYTFQLTIPCLEYCLDFLDGRYGEGVVENERIDGVFFHKISWEKLNTQVDEGGRREFRQQKEKDKTIREPLARNETNDLSSRCGRLEHDELEGSSHRYHTDAFASEI